VKPLIVPFFISHRGCPHQCVFCDQVKIAGSGGELPTEAEMLGKIAAYRRSGRRSSVEVAFYGGTFTALPAAVQQKLLLPLGKLIAVGEVESIRVSTRPDAVDDQTARFLRGMGVRTVELGVQSMADDVLSRSGRGHTAADVVLSCSVLKETGISLGVQLMPGLPGDTPEKSLDSFMRVVALRPDFLRVYPTLVIAGTPLATLYENGLYRPLDLDEAVRLCKVMLHRAWQAGIPMIRMGLQPTAELETAGTVLSGPYHPAFRYLVEAELCFDLLVRMTRGIASGSQLEVSCAPAMVSSLVGHRRGNVERLARLYGLTLGGVRGDPALSPFEIIVERAGEVRRGDLIADLAYP
jgi:histone acetyltransferase (RNA polymerase elongator complex component)